MLALKTIDDAFDGHCHRAQALENPFLSERLTFPEHYLHGHSNLLCLVRDGDAGSGIVVPDCNSIVFSNSGKGSFLNDDFRGRWVNIPDIEALEPDQRLNGQYELVLVGNIKLMQSVEQVVAARVRFQFTESLDDLFSGELYLSMRNSRFKTLRFAHKRKLNIVRPFGGKWPDNVPCQVVEAGSQVMDCVPCNEGELVGNGRVYLDCQGALAGMSIILDEEVGTRAFAKGLRPRMKVFDVLLGPL